MGLDQYAFRVDENGERTEIAYWRKHNRLQGWMENLWYEIRKNTEEFNCVDMELNWEDVMQLATDIEKRNLPDTTGFFYGSDSYDYGSLNGVYEDLPADLKFIETSKIALDCGDKVVYTCWY